jgi:hypothetical protein
MIAPHKEVSGTHQKMAAPHEKMAAPHKNAFLLAALSFLCAS